MQNLKNNLQQAVQGLQAINSNSKVKTGERVAVIALNKHDKKYPKANTKKTVIACLLGKI
jgi:hypothetical protein